ncbi:P-selectin-like [Sycon ciliatum]|uniref:P-selectin-like n=1 Tax=Sycon ciliatum TaxID=27933 RepID=UPI0031F6E852
MLDLVESFAHINEHHAGIKCPTSVSSPSFGTVTTGINDVFSSRKYICNAGYQLQGVLCSSQVAPINGSIDTASVEINGATTFTCYSGYYVVGSSASVCLPNGTWSNAPPICKRIICPTTVPTPTYGAVTTGTDDVFSSRKYKCNHGYQLQGSSHAICLSTGSWSSPAPICKRVVCSHQNPPPNGAIASVSLEISGATIFTCSSGYKLLGSSASVCLPNGTWSNTPPTCESTSTQCPANPPPPFNGIVSPGGRNAFTTRTYSCNTGYQLSGATTTICQTTGAWSGTPPTCRRVVCSSQHAPSNGAIVSMSLEIYGATIFTCNSGYTLVGSSASVCLRNGAWSTSPPICQRIRCLSPLAPPINGNVSSGNAVFFSTREYSCSPGYEIYGAKSTVCQSDGNWSVSSPTCKEIKCDNLPSTPTNGFLAGQQNCLGSTRVLGCDEGYILHGSDRVIVCQADKTWSTTSATCVPRDCSTVAGPTNGMVFLTGYTVGATASFMCSHGYTLIGFSSATCNHGGVWSSPTPNCDRVMCPNVNAPANGAVSTGDTEVFTVRRFTCDTGFNLVGNPATVCMVTGTWSDGTPHCIEKTTTCPYLLAPANGFIDNGSLDVGSSREYSCSDGYITTDSTHTACLKNGQWSQSVPCCFTKHSTGQQAGASSSSSNIIAGVIGFCIGLLTPSALIVSYIARSRRRSRRITVTDNTVQQSALFTNTLTRSDVYQMDVTTIEPNLEPQYASLGQI